jgi:hypothetical protein
MFNKLTLAQTVRRELLVVPVEEMRQKHVLKRSAMQRNLRHEDVMHVIANVAVASHKWRKYEYLQ